MILHLVPATAERSGFAPQCSSRRCFMNFKLLHSWTQLASVGLSWTQLDPVEYHHLVRFDAGGAISTKWVVFWEGGVLPSAM